MYYQLGRAGRALDRFGVIEFATTIAPGVRDVLLTGKVYEAVQRNSRNKGARAVRRGGARRAADRADRPVPQRQQRAGRAGQGGPDQEPGRQRDDAVPLAADRRAPGHRAGGDAGPGDRRRHRRAARGAGCPSAAWWSTWSGPQDLDADDARPPPARGTLDPERGRGRPARRPGSRSTTAWSTACSPRPTTTPSGARSRTPSASWSASSTSRRTSCRGCRGGVDLGGALRAGRRRSSEQGMA